MDEKLRVDLYLFRARHFKSRNKAAQAVREGRIIQEGKILRSSSEVGAGDLLRIREKGLYRDIRIVELPGKNMSKEAARDTWADETPPDVSEQREMIDANARARGPKREGARPTKKERRDLDKLRKR